MFRPSAQQFTTIIRLQSRQTTNVNGALKAGYTDAVLPLHMCEYKPFYGTEAVQAGLAGITAGGTITMWYTPGVKIGDRILLNDDADEPYEVTSVENVENRGVYLILKVRRTVSA